MNKASKNYARTIGVFYGSDSAEHQVSISTAYKIIRELLELGFNVVSIYLTKDRSWQVRSINSLDDLANASQQIDNDAWQLDLGQKGKLLFTQRSGLFSKPRQIVVDIAFPAFHGLNGEDGTFQGLCNLLQVPYVGVGQASSVLTMDKVLTKDVLHSYDLPTKRFVFFTEYEWKLHGSELQKAIESLEFPVFVKPARTGSSLGISKLDIIDTLNQSLDKAFKFDNKVLIEEAVHYPAELLISVVGNYFDPENIQVSSICIHDHQKGEFRLLKTKETEIRTLQNLAKRIFTTFELTGICQIDLIRNQKTKETFITEIDAMPRNLAFDIWQLSGVSSSALLRELIRLADQCAEGYVND